MTGCIGTTQQMVKQGATSSEFSADAAKCDYEATASTQTTAAGMRSIVGEELDRVLRKRDLMKRCLVAQGWSPQ